MTLRPIITDLQISRNPKFLSPNQYAYLHNIIYNGVLDAVDEYNCYFYLSVGLYYFLIVGSILYSLSPCLKN